MPAPAFAFAIEAEQSGARAAVFHTPHGEVATPAFMAVGTLATVKALDPQDLRAMGARMILANAYHLHLRPGDELIRDLGGLHRFMDWDGRAAARVAGCSSSGNYPDLPWLSKSKSLWPTSAKPFQPRTTLKAGRGCRRAETRLAVKERTKHSVRIRV